MDVMGRTPASWPKWGGSNCPGRLTPPESSWFGVPESPTEHAKVLLLVIPGLALGGENEQWERGKELTDPAQELERMITVGGLMWKPHDAIGRTSGGLHVPFQPSCIGFQGTILQEGREETARVVINREL